MTKKDSFFLVFTCIVYMALIACEQERDPCLQPTTAPLRVVAKRPSSDTTVVDSLLPHPIWLRVDTSLGILFPKKTGSFSLLLSPLSDSSTYALQPDSAAVRSLDTITFVYGRKLQFLSNACGFSYFYSLQTVRSSNHNIDSIKIINREVNLNASSPEHVQIYF